MERNLAAEIDALRAEIAELRSLLTAPAAPEESHVRGGERHPRVGHVQKMPGMHKDPAIMSILDRMENQCSEDGSTGRITYMGVFASGGRQSTWIKNGVNTDNLLSLIEDSTAERVLGCIGSREKLAILLAILKKPHTVAQLIEEGGFTSTGQVYHHLRPLLTADLVKESPDDGKGCYIIQPHRVQGIIMLLAGISDMSDTQYSRGQWNSDPQ